MSRLLIVILWIGSIITGISNAQDITPIQQVVNRIVHLTQQQPQRYTPQVITASLHNLQSRTSKIISQSIIATIKQHMTNYFSCLAANGQWVSTHLECEWIDEDICSGILGGTFSPCASACRHLHVDICTLECVPVCHTHL